MTITEDNSNIYIEDYIISKGRENPILRQEKMLFGQCWVKI